MVVELAADSYQAEPCRVAESCSLGAWTGRGGCYGSACGDHGWWLGERRGRMPLPTLVYTSAAGITQLATEDGKSHRG